MKVKMSPSTKFLILLFIIPILLWRCESEENLILKEKTIEQKSFIKTVENVTIDALSSELKKTFINSKREHKSKSEKDIYYDFNNIVKMVDTLGNIKYSIVFQLNNQPKNVLHNLIVNTDNNNRDFRYVMKYTIDNLDESDEDLYNFSNFKGTVERYSYEYILKNEKRLILGAKDELIYPCLKSVSSGSGVSYGGHGGGGSSNNNYGGSSSGSSTTGSGIRFGFNTFYYYSGTKITGLTTEGVINDANTGPLVTAPVPNDCVSISNFEAIIDECDDDIFPINPECFGLGIDENGNCIENSIVVENPDNPINNIDDYLECFNINLPATLTVYVNEPNPGSGDTYNNTFVGHTFISIVQGNNVNTFGFYPVSDSIYPVINNSSNSILGDDGVFSEEFSASVETIISGIELNNILNVVKNYNPIYDLNSYNCTDFAIEIGNLGGLDLPASNGSWPGGSGSNPGTLGKHIRTLSSGTNTSGGNAPVTKKDC